MVRSHDLTLLMENEKTWEVSGPMGYRLQIIEYHYYAISTMSNPSCIDSQHTENLSGWHASPEIQDSLRILFQNHWISSSVVRCSDLLIVNYPMVGSTAINGFVHDVVKRSHLTRWFPLLHSQFSSQRQRRYEGIEETERIS
jgi:hypothetical protein